MDTKKLRQKLLDLAIHGRLVSQDPADEPASALLQRIREEKLRLAKEGKIKLPKKAKGAADTPPYGNDAPFEVPKSWEWTAVNDISASILYGVSESAKSSGRYKLLRITDIQNNKVEWVNVPFTDFDETKVEAYLLKDGDILFARTGATVGKSYLVKGIKEQSIYASYLIRVQTIDAILPDYVKLFFESGFYWEQIERNSVGIGQPNVNGTVLGNLQIPIPPYAEQQRLIKEVERWFTLIDKIEQGKADLQAAVKQAKAKILDLAIHGKLVPQDPSDEPASDLLRRINPNAAPCDKGPYGNDAPFEVPQGWVWTTLGEISNYGNCTNVGVDDIRSDEWILELEDIEKDTAEIIKQLSKGERNVNGVRHSFQKGDVLYSKLRTYLNKVLVAPNDGYCTTEIIPFKALGDISPSYVCHVLRSPYFLEYTAQCGYGVKMPRLSTTDARKGFIPLPPLAEQQRIVRKTTELFGALDKITESL